MSDNSSRVLAIGLDGAEISYIRSRAQRLPNLSRCLENGQVYEPAPPLGLSGSVWPTFYTGSPPGGHGMYQHLVWSPEDMGLRRISPEFCKAPPFWQALDEQNKKCTVFDVPYSFSQPLRHGTVITDWATHGQTWPTAATTREANALLQEAGDSPIGRETPVQKTDGQLEKIQRSLIDSAQQKGALLATLAEQSDYDLLIAVFAETHRGGHTLWSAPDTGTDAEDSPLLEVYRAVDSAIGHVLESAKDSLSDVVIFSVHGMMPDYNQAHLIRPLMKKLNQAFTREHLGKSPAHSRTGGVVRALRRMVPAQLQLLAGSMASDGLREWIVEQEITGGLDWSMTPGFALRTDIRTELRLNIQGREAEGMLIPGSTLHLEYVAWVREVFLGLVDKDTGANLVEDILEPPKLFPGPQAQLLPDLVATWRAEPPARNVVAPRVGSLQIRPEPVRGGDHSDLGFAIHLGPEAGSSRQPPLTRTDEFAGFLTHLVKRQGATPSPGPLVL